MRVRLTKIDEYQFLTCLKHGLWGSKKAKFKDWQKGDRLVFIVDKALAGVAEVTGDPFESQEKVWDNGLFPQRIQIRFTHVLLPENRPPVLGEIRDALTGSWGTVYGWGILTQALLEPAHATTVVNATCKHPNDLEEFREHIGVRLDAAHEDRIRIKGQEITARDKSDKQAVIENDTIEDEDLPTTDPLGHGRAQMDLKILGKNAGCSVWIALSDRKKNFDGDSLGNGCLENLPNLGLSDDAIKILKRIDGIWIKQGVPVCGFEVETSTGIFPGLLRLADLLAVVPMIRVKLYIVAPRRLQKKFMRDVSRPTFQKNGLSDYCQFISTEDLSDLIKKTKDLAGHIQTTVLDSVAIDLVKQTDDGNEAA